jgi:hypothetical protein
MNAVCIATLSVCVHGAMRIYLLSSFTRVHLPFLDKVSSTIIHSNTTLQHRNYVSSQLTSYRGSRFHSGVVVPIGLYLWAKEGWRRFEWMFVFVLASISIIGSILQIVHDDADPSNKFIAIVNGIGLSPLLGIVLMLVHRLYA